MSVDILANKKIAALDKRVRLLEETVIAMLKELHPAIDPDDAGKEAE